MRDLRLPLGADEARSLKLGEQVTVSGMMFTGRSRFHIRAIEDDLYPPLDYAKVNCFFHVGPVARKTGEGWEIVSVEPTSSIRFERYGADVVRKFNLHVLIGKTTMGPGTAAALREVGGVHLTKIGLCGNQIKEQIRKVHDVFFLEELGKTEATWLLEVEKFGPFFVDMDARGDNYFETLAAEVETRMPSIDSKLGVPLGYNYTEVNAK